VRPGFQAVLFDWDGTLLDSAEATFRTYQTLFASFGIAFDRARFRETYSPDWYRTYAALELPRNVWEQADARWIELYRRETPALIAGAAESVARLRAAGLATGLVTSGSRGRVVRDLEQLKAAPLFDILICCEDAARKKPHPDPLEAALGRLSVEPSRAACVGDSPEDVWMARAAGVYSVAIAGGFPNHEELKASEPDAFADDLSTAARILLGRSGEAAGDSSG
jgi:phosphoglycolate phosphatase